MRKSTLESRLVWEDVITRFKYQSKCFSLLHGNLPTIVYIKQSINSSWSLPFERISSILSRDILFFNIFVDIMKFWKPKLNWMFQIHCHNVMLKIMYNLQINFLNAFPDINYNTVGTSPLTSRTNIDPIHSFPEHS